MTVVADRYLTGSESEYGDGIDLCFGEDFSGVRSSLRLLVLYLDGEE